MTRKEMTVSQAVAAIRNALLAAERELERWQRDKPLGDKVLEYRGRVKALDYALSTVQRTLW